MANQPGIPTGEALKLTALIATPESGIASRVLARSAGGNVTLFAFDGGQELSEHTAPFDALLMVLDGAFDLTIASTRLSAISGTVVLLPANIPHAVQATTPSRMLLIMLRSQPT